MYNGPSSEYGPNWNRRRWAVFKSLGYICQLCGKYSKGNLHLHHIKPLGCGGTNHPKNTTAVCKKCHSFIHSGNYHGPLLDLRNCRGRK